MRAKSHRRRALVLGAEVAGPVSAQAYLAVMRSGSCVYCGGQADSVDHVRPLSRGGWEHESNLVPACRADNSSKGSKLLTEWNQAKVARAASVSPKIIRALAGIAITAGR